MAGNTRFESSSASSEELAFSPSYSNGQRGSYSGANLDRSGSFREGSESRAFNSGISTPRGRASSTGDIPPLSHCLTLEPITIGDHKCTRSGELRKILGISSSTTSEDNCFGAAHFKAHPQVVSEEIKRFKTDVEDINMNARVRTKMFADRLNNLLRYGDSLIRSSKFREVPSTKKQQRNMMLMNERSVGSSLLKAGSQIHRNPSDPLTHRLDDRTKNVVLNRRVRTSVAEIRAEGRGNNLARQSMCMGKERDVPRDVVDGSELAEEKIRRLPTGGEGWDRKMKRKRSVGGVLVRSSEGDGEPKRTMHHKLNSDPVLQSCDGQGFRSGSSNGGNRIKLDANSQPSSSRVVPKGDLDKVSVSKDFASGLNKERLVVKGSKLNAREESQIVRSTNMTKGKATRAPRSGPIIAGNSSPNFSRPSGSVEVWEQPTAPNRIQSVSGMNRKRPLPAGSSSPPMAQWVGQRPQKISRTRRANLVSPISNHDEVQVSSEGVASDIGSKLTSGSSLLEKGNPTGTHNFKIKTENVRSPTQFSESEESGAGGYREIRSKEKILGSGEVDERVANSVQNAVPSMAITKKNKMSKREDIGDGVRRQGRSGRASSFSRAGFSPGREKLEPPAFTKPLRSAKPMSDKNGSKSGRPPLKKLSDRKVNRTGQTPSSSPDFTGESDDDKEDLVAAANFACNASYLGCSGKFWKRKELVFSTVSMEDIDHLKQEVKSAEELHESVSQMVGDGNNDPGGHALDEHSLSCLIPWDKDRRHQGQSASIEPLSNVGQIQDSSYFCGRIDSQGRKEVTPLYHRVLSALIVEDQMEEFEDGAGRAMSFQYHGDSFLPNNVENRHIEQLGNNSISGILTQEECKLDSYSRNGNTPFMNGTNVQNLSCRDNFFQGNHQLVHSQVDTLPEVFEKNVEGPGAGQRNAADIDGSKYEHMCLEERLSLELQSVDLYPEVPELSDGEHAAINGEISKIEKELNQKIGKKKAHLSKLLQAAEKGKESEERALEEVAMDRLVELAYRKKLATRKSTSRCGVPKVSKQVANAFMKRTIARLRKYEETGKSPFSEPALRDVLLAPPPRINIDDITDPPSSGIQGASDAARNVNHPSDQDFAKTGPILNRGKKKEVLLDDVGGSSSLGFASSFGGNLSGGAKGKRSESKTGRGERKTKTKPKQKTGQLSTPGSIPSENATNKRKDIRTVSSGNVPKASFNDVNASSEHPPHDLDSIEDLGGNDDFSNFLNFDDVGLQDSLQDNDVMGLDIPMDDLSDLMFV